MLTKTIVNRFVNVIFAALLVLSIVGVVNVPSVFAFDGGDGSPGAPYQISTCAQLQDMELDLTASYELVSDIDCSATSGWNSGAGFDPIGYDSSNRFSGTLEGNGFTISDFTINRPAENYVALIGYGFESYALSNFNMTNVSITGDVFGGSVIGYSSGTVALSDITVSGNVTCGSDCGGIGGALNSASNISNVHSSVDVVSTGTFTGGAFGYLQFSNNTLGVTDSSSSGSVTGESVVGGFVGEINWGTFTNVSATGNVIGDNDGDESNVRAGGFVGQMCNAVVENSFATGDVSGHDDIAGFLGFGASCDITIRDSYSRGNVTPSTPGDGGSFISFMNSGTVTNSYSTGSVAGQTNAGFIFDANTCTGCINNFYDSETTGQSLAGSDTVVGTDKTTAQMKTLATFTDTATAGLTSAWDFVGTPNDDAGNTDDWKIDGVTNDGYPFLTSQTLTPLPLTLTPTNNGTGIDPTDDLVMTFNTPSGASSGYINIYRASDNQLVEAIDVAGGSIAGNGTTTLTINPLNDLAEGTTYYVLIDATAIRANNGIYYAGISSSDTWQFTTSSSESSQSQSDTLASTGTSTVMYALAGVLMIVTSTAVIIPKRD